jgi:hypothetical protein
MLAIWASIAGPIGTLIVFMWYHFNNRFKKLDQKLEKLDVKIDRLRGEINRIGEKLSKKIDTVRDRSSRIEGQLVPAKIISFEEPSPRGITEQKSVIRQL